MILGITGGVAVGKSTAARFFAKLGAVVVSADALAREVVAPGSSTLMKLVEYFGCRILHNDGSLNRKVLGDIVFSDGDARRFVNNITHARIGLLAEEKLKALNGEGAPLIIYESPLLFEAGVENRVDKILVVRASREHQIKRLLRREGMTQAKAEAMIDSQMPQEEKAARADYVIDTTGTLGDLEEKIRRLFEKLTCS